MISALTWIPRGAARAKPVRFELSQEEINRIENLAKEEEEEQNQEAEEEEELDGDQPAAQDNKDDDDSVELPAEFRMDEYDEEDDMPDPLEDFDDAEDTMDIEMMAHGDHNLAYETVVDEDEAEDEQDNEIRPTDSLLVVAMTEDEQSHLEVQVLSDEGVLYVHHDILLPDLPLCMAWMDIPPFLSSGASQQTIGNYLAVGTFSPAIEIWNLDVLDPIEPSATLGGEDKTKNAKAGSKVGKKMPKKAYLPGSHTDAVMALSWNAHQRHILASGSADHSVKLWDVTTQQCQATLQHHSDKVQSVAWHGTESWLLATAAFDRKVSLIDARSGAVAHATTSMPADIESMTWDPFSPYHLYGSTEDGRVFCCDIRKCSSGGQSNANSKSQDSVLFSFAAHHKTTSALHFSSSVKGMLATSSLDKTVKVWDVRDVQQSVDGVSSINFANNSYQPKCVAYKSMNVGKLMTLRFSMDDPFLLATGGDKGVVAVWEADELEVIRAHFEDSIVSRPSAYASLSEEGSLSKQQSPSAPQPTVSLAETLQIQPEVQDDSWMEDNAGVCGAAGETSNDKKKKKKKKSAK